MMLPPIEPQDLRVHDEASRIERIWNRLDANVRASEPTPSSLSLLGGHIGLRGHKGLVFVATAACFAGGVAVGTRFADPSQPVGPERAAISEHVTGTRAQVYAAGSSARTFVLDNGVKITLNPEGLLELQRDDGQVPVLALIRGNVSVDASRSSLAIASGDATLRGQKGSVFSVRLASADELEVWVTSGVVDVRSPGFAGKISERGVQRVITRAKVALREEDTKREHSDVIPRNSPSSEPRGDEVAIVQHEPAAPIAQPSWYDMYKSERAADALRVVDQSGGFDAHVSKAQSAGELLALEDLARLGGRTDVRIRALTRIVEEFEGSTTSIAARSLANIYERAGNKEKASYYNARLKGTAFEQDALCGQLRGQASRDSISQETLSLAQGYLLKYTDGTCRELAQSIVDDAALQAKGAKPVEKKDGEEKKDAGVKVEQPEPPRSAEAPR